MEKKKQDAIIITIIFATLLFLGCNIGNLEENKSNNKTPFALISELEDIAKDSETYVDWRIARVFAVTEKESFAKKHDWSETKVSNKPIIIYDNEYNPKYYEFRVIKDSIEVGAITCNAKKSGGTPVKYIMDFTHDYEDATYDRGNNNTNKIIDTGYPAKFYQGNLLDRSIDPTVDLPSDNSIEFEVSTIEFLENADSEILTQLGISTDEMKADLLQKAKKKQEELSQMWNDIEEYKELIITTTDEEIEQVAKKASSSRANYSSTYYATNWYNKRYWNPEGWCGPAALAFVSIGAGSYPGVTWTPVNNYETNKTIYNTFLNRIGTGPKVWEDLAPALSQYTSYKLDLGWLGDKSHDWGKINGKMRAYSSPALSLRTWASVNGVWSWGWHYRVIIGTHHDHKEWTEYFLWWPIAKSSDSYYYYMHDNGADGFVMAGNRNYNWWEVAGSFAQFESVTVKKK